MSWSQSGRRRGWSLLPAAPQFCRESVHGRPESFAKPVDRDQGNPGPADVGAGTDLAGDAWQNPFASAHDEDLVRPTGLPRAISLFLEERYGEIQNVDRGHPGNSLLLEGRAFHLGFDFGSGGRRHWRFAHHSAHIQRFAGSEHDDLGRRRLFHLCLERLRILLDRRERVVVTGDDRISA